MPLMHIKYSVAKVIKILQCQTKMQAQPSPLRQDVMFPQGCYHLSTEKSKEQQLSPNKTINKVEGELRQRNLVSCLP